MGQIMWHGLYIILGSFGGSQISPGTPKTILTEFVNHTVFGITAAIIAANLGDETLFSSKKQMSASAPAQGRQAQTIPSEQSNSANEEEMILTH